MDTANNNEQRADAKCFQNTAPKDTVIFPLSDIFNENYNNIITP